MYLAALVVAGVFLAQTAQSTTVPSLRAHRAETAPTIDGRLDEAVWKAADPGDNFRQIEPIEGVAPTERTEIRVLYDNVSLYVGVRLYDSEPDKIVRRLSRRDDDPDADKFTFYVDALHDRLTGAAFEVSAAGAQRDAIISNDTNRDSSWDAVWDAVVSIDNEGWSAELRIPLSQLRFLKSDNQTWGFNVERFIYRKNERVWFEMVPRNENGLASRMANLTGIDGVQPRRAFELVPYVVARSEFIKPRLAGDPFNDGSRYFGATGFDLKYALKPNIVLNASVNPDFGQVEIDPAVVNLDAFETFFSERRPFFTEGAQIFDNFGALGSNNRLGFNRNEPNLIHTRRIGRPPQGFAGGDFVDTPDGATILGAAKITGKTDSNWSFGILDALTAREYARASTGGLNSRSEVEPFTNYFAARLLKEFGGGRSGVGALVKKVNRDLRDPSLKDLLAARGSVAGVDAYYFLDSDREWVVNGRMVFSDVAGSARAIERLQLEPQRYFQRTETPQVRFDPTRTSLRGWNGDVNLNRNFGGLTVNSALWAVSPGFESGDLGFHFDGDSWGTHTGVTWKQLQPDRLTRYRDILVAKFYVWDFNNVTLADGVMSFANLTFLNYWGIGGNAGFFRETQDNRLTRGGPPSRVPAEKNANVYLNSDSRKNVVLHLDGGLGKTDAGGSSGDGSLSVEWKPSPKVNLSTGPSYSHSLRPAQYVATVDDPSAAATHGKRYVFARLNQKNLSLDTRVNVLFSPKMSLQVYMQPLLVVGDYTDFKSLARPKTFEFAPYPNAPFDPTFNFKSLRVNAIFRWEWRLGSTLYVAWTQQRIDDTNPGQFQFNRDFGRVFTGPADNVFMIKMSRWFSK
jgi:hypothetical protein